MKRLIRLPEVKTTVGFSRSQIYALMRLGKFPSSVRLSKNAVAWDADVVQEWVNKRIADSAASS